MKRNYGRELRAAINEPGIMPMIGAYDVFSATIAAQQFDGIFISGFGFGASYYGLPDIGFNAWPDVVAYVQRVRTVLPEQAILVDIDDGFADNEVACHVVSVLESAGASGVILEDQTRPRRCGHMAGKLIMPLEDYLEKLHRVLETRKDLVVVARTDSSGREEILRRVEAFSATDADVILVDGIGDPALLAEIRAATEKPLAFNQIFGGASLPRRLDELEEEGISLAIYSTPCLFAAQDAMVSALSQLKSHGGLSADTPGVTLGECNEVLEANLRRRDTV